MEKPDWNRGDGIKSIRDVGRLVLDAIADLIPIDTTFVIDEPPLRIVRDEE